MDVGTQEACICMCRVMHYSPFHSTFTLLVALCTFQQLEAVGPVVLSMYCMIIYESESGTKGSFCKYTRDKDNKDQIKKAKVCTRM